MLFLTSLGMGIAAQSSGRLSDRFGPRPFTLCGFAVMVITALAMSFLAKDTALWAVMVLLFVNGLAMGLWNVPNNSVIMGAVPVSRLGVVGALSNLTRNVGNVVGQAFASGVVVAVMVAQGFDVPLSEIADSAAAGSAFIDGWRIAYLLAAAYLAVALILTYASRPQDEDLAR